MICKAKSQSVKKAKMVPEEKGSNRLACRVRCGIMVQITLVAHLFAKEDREYHRKLDYCVGNYK